ncbi:hypothetical protein EDC94DRAFT_510311, partial [Helicostylum pulchrum]
LYEPTDTLSKFLKILCIDLHTKKIIAKNNSENTFIDNFIMFFVKTVIIDSCSSNTTYSLPHKSSKYQPEDNYCKLMEYLKSSIDIQLSLKIEDPVSLGILCEGFLCSLIRMTLVEDGIYLPVVIRKFMFPESLIVSLHIPIAVEYFSSVSDELKKFDKKYNDRKVRVESTKATFKKSSFVTKSEQ